MMDNPPKSIQASRNHVSSFFSFRRINWLKVFILLVLAILVLGIGNQILNKYPVNNTANYKIVITVVPKPQIMMIWNKYNTITGDAVHNNSNFLPQDLAKKTGEVVIKYKPSPESEISNPKENRDDFLDTFNQPKYIVYIQFIDMAKEDEVIAYTFDTDSLKRFLCNVLQLYNKVLNYKPIKRFFTEITESAIFIEEVKKCGEFLTNVNEED
ncbi:uncharacterized protein LOC119675836 [Teleopsis dalmanni]|uniref:uncharacterized protein LOC119675836 n=1 Tax=Teleopsis dalmanni TaxID=139649 RepID=UPI0018CE8E48|nr:uncharacterized protein LOC119675836 [Teleopsis dalmanni]